MGFKFHAAIFTVSVSLVVCVGVGLAGSNYSEISPEQTAANHEGDQYAQKISVSNIVRIALVIKQFMKNTGTVPIALIELTEGEVPYIRPDVAKDLLLDGWGNAIYYTTNGTDFILVSHGRDGLPVSPDLRLTHGSSAHGDYDADMVMINGKWAQSPADHCKY